MKTPLKLLAVLAVGATLTVAGGLAPGKDGLAKLGEKAPAFTLVDLDGNEHSLADFAGKNVVLEWTNPGCPFIQGCYNAKVVAHTVAKMNEMGDNFVYLAVNSTGNMPKDEVIKQNAAFLKSQNLDFPVLIDHDGTVGRMYDARTTPHVFVIDGEGVLRYHGAYTDDARGKNGTDATNYVLNALEQIAAGETVAPDQVKPWGCSVKYVGKGKGKDKN